MMQSQTNNGLIRELWHSFRSLPLWVQIWMAFVLVPVNIASLNYISQPAGIWIAFLANIAMLPNLPIIFYQRGFSKMLAFPHILPWTILVVWLLFARPEGSAGYGVYLWILLGTNLISLCFDYTDVVKWWRGERSVPGR